MEKKKILTARDDGRVWNEKTQAWEQAPLAVLVTTDRRGVFFGYTEDPTADPIRLTQCRLVVRWIGTHGFLGLAANGPTKECRIGPAAPAVSLKGVTCVAECSPEAVQAFEAGPWA